MSELSDIIKRHVSWGPITEPDRLRFLSLALCGEAGEFANVVKKNWRGDGGPDGVLNRKAKLVEELADVANYAFLIAECLGVDLEAAMLKKLKEVEKRPIYAGQR
jgi:NTP pyrophosphatase (non-canonical NTP hydrolase)